MTLTILCVTDGQPYAQPFIDNMEQLAADLGCGFVEYDGTCAGYIEKVLDEAIADCPDGYILRLDDDEKPDAAMVDWLAGREYEASPHWAFPRLNLYPDEEHYLTGFDLYPDPQTRLSTKRMSGGRHLIHDGSPYGTGRMAPCHIEHHKFLVRTLEERWETLYRYEQLQPGAGSRFVQFSAPEDLHDPRLQVVAREVVPA